MGKHKNVVQKSILIGFMKKHKHLAIDHIPGEHHADAELLWKEVTEALNLEGPPIKSPNGWRKEWAHWKNEVRKKLSSKNTDTDVIAASFDEAVAKLAGLFDDEPSSFIFVNTNSMPADGIARGNVADMRNNGLNDQSSDIEIKEEEFMNEEPTSMIVAASSNTKRRASGESETNSEPLRKVKKSANAQEVNAVPPSGNVDNILNSKMRQLLSLNQQKLELEVKAAEKYLARQNTLFSKIADVATPADVTKVNVSALTAFQMPAKKATTFHGGSTVYSAQKNRSHQNSKTQEQRDGSATEDVKCQLQLQDYLENSQQTNAAMLSKMDEIIKIQTDNTKALQQVSLSVLKLTNVVAKSTDNAQNKVTSSINELGKVIKQFSNDYRTKNMEMMTLIKQKYKTKLNKLELDKRRFELEFYNT